MKVKWPTTTIQHLKLSSEGLKHDVVTSQRVSFGPNAMIEATSNPLIDVLLNTLKDPMIWFLVVIGAIFFVIGETTDAVVLLVAIVPLTLMDAFLHWRTQASVSSLRSNLSSKVRVVREGKEIEIDSQEIVPGDVVCLAPHSFIPADGIFISVDSLQADESALTGEAFPLKKNSFELQPEVWEGREELWVHEIQTAKAGTRVLSGVGRFIATATGKSTEYAKIVQAVFEVPTERTPLQILITKLVNYLLLGASFFCFILAAIRYYQGHGLLDAFLSAATLAIAAIPEEFPVVFTFFLGVGVYRLATKKALVRRAVSVENIGRVNRICTDKTGTVTVGELNLTHLHPIESVTDEELLSCALNASHSTGFDPVDEAILRLAQKKSISHTDFDKRCPFTEDRKRESALIKSTWYTKGAPEAIYQLVDLSHDEMQKWKQKTKELASEGHKVLACALKTNLDIASSDEPQTGYSFLGLLAFEDPARPEVLSSVSYCRENKIKVTMITGDHPETAIAIGKDIGLVNENSKIISAEDEEAKHGDDWPHKVLVGLDNVDVIARCRPIQKLKIVEFFKGQGELIAVTGDGVNDVPALKMADISLAMGARGTRSAKEVSHIIITDDNFSTIVNAIKEGKILFQNLRYSFEYLLLFHIPFVLSAAIVPLMGYPILFLPIHIVWLELIVHPTALFAFQANQDERGGVPRDTLFTWKEFIFILIAGTIFTLCLLMQFHYSAGDDTQIALARSVVLGMMVLWSSSVAWALSGKKNKMAVAVILSSFVGSVLLMETPWIAKSLHVTSLGVYRWGQLLLMAILITGPYRRLRRFFVA